MCSWIPQKQSSSVADSFSINRVWYHKPFSEKSTNEMTMANMGKASTAVRKPKIKRAGISLRLKRDLTQARGIVIATQSTAASAAGIQATFICGGFFGFAYTKERNWAYFACGAKLPERKLKRGRAILYHVWRVLTWLDLTTYRYNPPLRKIRLF